MENENDLMTVGAIAEKLGEPVARVGYVISKLRLKPVRRAGILRLFDSMAVEDIKRGLYGLQIRGGGRG